MYKRQQYLLGAGIKKVATVHDKKTYGQGLVEAFTKEFTAKGGSVATAQTINPDDSNYSAVVQQVKSSGATALYYGGEYPQMGPLSKQLHGAGVAIPLMGGDGVFDKQYILSLIHI